MLKPKREFSAASFRALIAAVVAVAILIPTLGVAARAADPSPSASASPTASASESASPTPTPTPTFDPDLHSIDAADSLWVVVNKQRKLNPVTYLPKSMVKPKSTASLSNPYRLPLVKVAAKALVAMAADMKAAGAGKIVINSAYRSFASQKSIHAAQVARLGLKAGEALAARPGFSEHQTGLAADISAAGQGCVIAVCFSKTRGGKWLAANSWRYGFILRYPNGKTAITGYQFEPWHFRFVGTELAAEYKARAAKTLEGFWSLPNAPRY